MHRTLALKRAIAATAIAAAIAATTVTASATTIGTISGTAYQDLNRNGVQDTGEGPLANHRLYLLSSATGAYLTSATTDDTGRYAFTGLADAAYRVEYEGNTWRSIRQDWVPTTTGSIYPRQAATVGTAADAIIDFGWRPILRSTTLGSPISSVVGPSGIRVESYNDATTAQEVHDELMSGQLVGAEASTVTIRFDYGPYSATATSVQTIDGKYDGYSAVVTATWDSFLTTHDRTLVHEYGHAWSLYYAYIAQQDASLAGYLKARGLDGDARVGSTYGWDAAEMIAEDYRQLFGTPTSAQYAQINSEIPLPNQVPGLRDFLQTTFRQAPTTTTTTVAPPSEPALSISGLTVNPTHVRKSGIVSFELSSAATVTVEIRDASGSVVRTLLSGASMSAESVSTTWDRTYANGRRAKTGSYSAAVTATGATLTTSSSVGFTVA